MKQLYLELKVRLRIAYKDLPDAIELRQKIWQFWSAYVNWSCDNPVERCHTLARRGSEAFSK
jgi:hypothetical protein